MDERRYWRPETERLMEEFGKAREMDLLQRLIRPTVIRLTAEEERSLEERFQEQIIKPVDFSKLHTASAGSVSAPSLECLLRTVEQINRELKLIEARDELAKLIEESMTGIYEVGELKLVEPERDPWEFRKFWLMSEPFSSANMVLYGRTDKNEE